MQEAIEKLEVAQRVKFMDTLKNNGIQYLLVLTVYGFAFQKELLILLVLQIIVY